MDTTLLPASATSGIDTTKAVAPFGRQVGGAVDAGILLKTEMTLAKLLYVMRAEHAKAKRRAELCMSS